jgi:hypothetical protein
MKINSPQIYSLLFLLVFACSNHQPVAVLSEQTLKPVSHKQTGADDSQEAASGILDLSWDKPQQDVQSYHIFYTRSLKATSGGTLVGTLKRTGEEDIPTSAEIALTKLGHTPAAGTQGCFYIVAENTGGKSEPSDAVCLAL